MDDRALYQTMLGWSEPWTVERVELREAEPAVPVFVEAAVGTAFTCPDGGATVPVHDHAERRWRQLDTCQVTTLLVAHVPRVQCGTHGVTTVRGPWAEKGSRFTLLVERLAIAWLKDATPTAVARRLGLTWDEARGMQVRRGASRVGAAVARAGRPDRHRRDECPEAASVCEPCRRSRRAAGAAWGRRPARRAPRPVLSGADGGGTHGHHGHRAGPVGAMWEPSRTTVREQGPDGERKIVFDTCHVLQHVGVAVEHLTVGPRLGEQGESPALVGRHIRGRRPPARSSNGGTGGRPTRASPRSGRWRGG